MSCKGRKASVVGIQGLCNRILVPGMVHLPVSDNMGEVSGITTGDQQAKVYSGSTRLNWIQGEGASDGDVLFEVENVEGGPRCAFTCIY